MPSFATLSILATIAFSAFTSAIPVDPPVPVPVDVPVAVSSRADSSVSPVSVLTNLKNQLGPISDKLTGMSKDDATTANVSPLIDEMKSYLTTAISSIKGMSKQSRDVVLVREDAPLENVAALVADVLSLVVLALVHLLDIVGPTGDLVGILGPVGPLLTELLSSLIPVVIGLVTVLGPLVAGLLGGVGALVSALGLGPLIVILGL